MTECPSCPNRPLNHAGTCVSEKLPTRAEDLMAALEESVRLAKAARVPSNVIPIDRNKR